MARRAPIRRPGSKARKVVAVGVLAVLCLIPMLSVFVQRVSASTQGGILDTTWPTSVSGFNLTAILVAPDGKIWTAHAQGTNAYTTTGSISVATKWEGSIPSSLATQVTDAGTYVLAGTSAGIYRYWRAPARRTQHLAPDNLASIVHSLFMALEHPRRSSLPPRMI